MPKKKSKFSLNTRQIVRILQFILFVVLLGLLPGSGQTNNTPLVINEIKSAPEIILPPPPPIPVNRTNALPPFLTAESVVIKDLNSGVNIFSKAEKKVLFPASTTKVMTALIILEKYGLDDIFTVKTVVSEGRKMNLIKGEELTVESLLYGALVHSANDAAYALAENYPGGVDAFVEAMNRKSESLGLKDTNFTNPVGFDDPRHYTTAEDLVNLSVYALKNKTFDKIVSTKAITVSDVSFTYFHELTSVYQLLGKIAGISGVKTGYTENAGEILISTVRKNGNTVLFAVLKSLDRFGETVLLIDWVFNNFTWTPVAQITPN